MSKQTQQAQQLTQAKQTEAPAPTTPTPTVPAPPEPVIVPVPDRPVDVVARAVQAFVDARTVELATRDQADALLADISALTSERNTLMHQADQQAQACLQAAQDAKGILETFITNQGG